MDDSKYQNEWTSYYYGQTATPKKQCVCGCLKTFGEKCNTEFHSDWCPYSPNFIENKDKKNISMFGDSYD